MPLVVPVRCCVGDTVGAQEAVMGLLVTESASDEVDVFVNINDSEIDAVNDTERLIVSSAVTVEMHCRPR